MDFLKKNITYVLLAIVFVISFSTIFNSKLDLNGDNFNYLMLSKSIAQGKGYVSTISGEAVPTNFYPPGYPGILAFFRLFLGENIIAFKIINGIFLLLSVYILFNISKGINKNVPLFFCVSVLVLLNIHLLRFSTMIMSEIPFLLFTTLAIYAIYKLPTENNFLKSPYFYLLIFSISISYYIREVGVVIFIATVIHYLLQKKWKISGAVVLSFVLLYLPWSVRNSMHGIKSRYLGTVMVVNPWRPEEGEISSVKEFIEKMISNFDETVIKGFNNVLFPFLKIDYRADSSALLIVSAIIVLLITFWGAYKMGKLKYLFIFFILGNMGIFMLWHGGNGARYVVPLIPVLFFTFFNGLFDLLKYPVKNEKLLSQLGYVLLLFGFFYFPGLKELGVINSQDYPANYKNYINIAKSLKANTPKNTVVCGRKPEILYYYSERPSCNYLYSSNTDEVLKDLEKNKVSYVILEQLGYGSTARYLFPAIQANPARFKTLIQLKNPDTYLLEFVKPQENS